MRATRYKEATISDIVIAIPTPKARDLLNDQPGEPFADLLDRISRTREIIATNRMDSSAKSLLEHAVTRLLFSPHRVEQVRAVGITISRLAGHHDIRAEHIAEAIQYANP